MEDIIEHDEKSNWYIVHTPIGVGRYITKYYVDLETYERERVMEKEMDKNFVRYMLWGKASENSIRGL